MTDQRQSSKHDNLPARDETDCLDEPESDSNPPCDSIRISITQASCQGKSKSDFDTLFQDTACQDHRDRTVQCGFKHTGQDEGTHSQPERFQLFRCCAHWQTPPEKGKNFPYEKATLLPKRQIAPYQHKTNFQKSEEDNTSFLQLCQQ